MEKPEFFILKKEELRNIRMYRIPLDSGSDITCYQYDNNNVIKLFEITCKSPQDKLYIPHHIYGNSSYNFVNKVGTNDDHLITCYTMPFIRGEKLSRYNFNELYISTLLYFISIFLDDTNKISNNGIFAYDNFISNIIINDTGFHCIDPIDFTLMDKDPSFIESENIKIFFTNFWDYLFNDDLRYFCNLHHLEKEFLYTDPIGFFIELTNIVSNIYNKEITSVKEIKILTKRR